MPLLEKIAEAERSSIERFARKHPRFATQVLGSIPGDVMVALLLRKSSMSPLKKFLARVGGGAVSGRVSDVLFSKKLKKVLDKRAN